MIAFAQDVRQVQLPTTVEVNPEWLNVTEDKAPSVEDPTRALTRTGPRYPRTPYQMAISDKVTVPPASIHLLRLVQFLLSFTFLSLKNTWNVLVCGRHL